VLELLSLPKLICDRDFCALALQLFVGHPAPALEDCALAVGAELQDAVLLWTFDQKLASRTSGARLVPRLGSRSSARERTPPQRRRCRHQKVATSTLKERDGGPALIGYVVQQQPEQNVRVQCADQPRHTA
jgi:hypothetical protein